MFAILEHSAPFFTLILAGYLAVCWRWLAPAAIDGLNIFVLYFALPCMLFRFGSGIGLAQLLQPAIWLVYSAAACCMVLLALSRSREYWGWNDSAFGALVTAFPNTGFLGFPLLLALLGPEATAPIVITIMVDMVCTSSVCIALSRLEQPDGPSLKKIIEGVLSNPLPWAIVLGVLYALLPWTLPTPANTVIDLFANAASPVALFTIGAMIGRSFLRAQTARQSSAPSLLCSDYLSLALFKLLLHPLIIFAFGLVAIDQGWSLSPQTLSALILVAALPSASNVSLLGERYGAYAVRLAYIILASTALSFVSFLFVAELVLR